MLLRSNPRNDLHSKYLWRSISDILMQWDSFIVLTYLLLVYHIPIKIYRICNESICKIYFQFGVSDIDKIFISYYVNEKAKSSFLISFREFLFTKYRYRNESRACRIARTWCKLIAWLYKNMGWASYKVPKATLTLLHKAKTHIHMLTHSQNVILLPWILS